MDQNQEYDHAALYREIKATYKPPFHASMTTQEMLAILNGTIDAMLTWSNLAGSEKTTEQYRQEIQHAMDKECVKMLLKDRGEVLVSAGDEEYWTSEARKS
jgi:hypothetical protein